MTTKEISGENIGQESYYNLIQLCRITGFADPIAAMKHYNRAKVHVNRDECGNILSGRLAGMHLHASAGSPR